MSRDAFDRFQPRERGLFGDNEQAEAPGRGPRPRVTNASDLVDIAMVHHLDVARPTAVMVSADGERQRAVWLARSLIEIEDIGPIERKRNGVVVQAVRITLPGWLAKEKGLL